MLHQYKQKNQQGLRLLCDKCFTENDQIIPFARVEQILFNTWQEQQQYIQEETKKTHETAQVYNDLIKQFQSHVLDWVNKYCDKLRYILNFQIQEYKKVFENEELNQIINLIKQDFQLTQSDMERIAQFIIKYEIMQSKIQIPKPKSNYNLGNENFLALINDPKTYLDSQLNNLITYKLEKTLSELSETINITTISSDKKWVASSSSNRTINLWDLGSFANKKTYKLTKQIPNTIQFSPDNKYLACGGGEDLSIYCYDISNLCKDQPSKIFQGHASTINQIIFTSDSQYLISASFDCTIRIWNMKLNKEICQIQTKYFLYGIALSNLYHLGAVGYSYDSNGQAMLWQLDKQNLDQKKNQYNFLKEIETDQECTYSIDFSTDSKLFVTSGDDMIVKLWNIYQVQTMKNPEPIRIFDTNCMENPKILKVKFSSNSKYICSLICSASKILIWNLENGNLSSELVVPAEFLSHSDADFSISNDMSLISTGGNQIILHSRVI